MASQDYNNNNNNNNNNNKSAGELAQTVILYSGIPRYRKGEI
jgi:hypothetical protein